MKDLYEEYEIEREKLNRLAIQAIATDRSFATNDEIIAQSRKVDTIIEKLAKHNRLNYSQNVKSP